MKYIIVNLNNKHQFFKAFLRNEGTDNPMPQTFSTLLEIVKSKKNPIITFQIILNLKNWNISLHNPNKQNNMYCTHTLTSSLKTLSLRLRNVRVDGIARFSERAWANVFMPLAVSPVRLRFKWINPFWSRPTLAPSWPAPLNRKYIKS